MAIVYLEAPTMKELHKKIYNFNHQEVNQKNGLLTVSWINIQKEDDKYVCIASSTSLTTIIRPSSLLNVWVDGGTTLDVNVKGGSLDGIRNRIYT